MSSRITTTGVNTTPGPNGSVPIRRELRDLQANFKDLWNVYILGLVQLQKKPVTDLQSYYSLAGIHGEPFVPWNGVTGNEKASFGGYCTHSSILFLPWHRPYLAAYEQALYASVQKVASQFPESMRARYVTAAKDFRMPYWDWAARTTGQTSAFPTAISSSGVSVIDVDGAPKTINNPLYSFRFSDKEIPEKLALDSYWSQFANTKRSPDQNGNSQNALVSRVITNESASLRNNVSLVLLSYKNFDAFSDNTWARDDEPGTYGSVEDMHNEIHDKVGQGGHMGSLEVSAFDPVFWLHHTNVDRLWAIWQAMNPNAYVIDKVSQAREANFTIAANTRLTANTDLKPFYDSTGTKFWNSAGVKTTTSFNYAYAETQRWLYPSDQAYQTAVRNQVTKQYGGNVINNFFENIAAAPKDVPMAAALVTSANVSEAKPALSMNFAKKAVAHPIQAAQEILGNRLAKDTAVSISATNGDGAASKIADSKPAAASTPASVQAHAQRPTQPSPQAPSQATLHAQATAPVQSFPQAATATQQTQARSSAPSQTQPRSDPQTSAPVPLNVPSQFAHLVPGRTYTEWVTNLRALKHGLGQTFRVYVFLGDFNPDPTTWPTEYNVVGRFTVLGRGGETQCEKCQNDAADDLIVTGTVPLTSALLQDIVEGQLASLKPEDVGPYLEKNLHWRVTVFDGSEQPRDEVPGLKVAVVSTQVRIGDDGTPVYSGVYDQYPGITDGRPAGLGSGDQV